MSVDENSGMKNDPIENITLLLYERYCFCAPLQFRG